MLNEREQAAHDPTIAETAQGLSLAFEKLKADISQSRAARFVLAVLEKLKGAIQMEKTLKTGKIGQFGAESRVTYGGVKWVVLDARPNMSLCLAEDVLKDENGEVRYMAFDTDNKNDFAASSVRAFLNGDFLEELAAALDTTPAWLLGIETAAAPPPGFEPLPEMARVPLVGSIACGTPITAEQNIESYIGVPAAWHADFALTCHGSSMAPTICDGDIVCIRRQPEVEQGEIAAVRIGDEATLKHFHRQGGTVMLLADNAAVCPPMIYAGSQLEEIQIEGRAVGFCRGL